MSGAGKSRAVAALEDLGYYCVDKDSTPERLVFNKTISLKDTFNK